MERVAGDVLGTMGRTFTVATPQNERIVLLVLPRRKRTAQATKHELCSV